MSDATPPDYHTAIVGAGFSGIGAAVTLDKAGLHDYLIIEAGDSPGGTGTGTPIPVSPLIFRRSRISSRSNKAPIGRGPTPPAVK